MTESRELLDDLQASTPEVRLGLSRAGVQGVAKAIRISWGGAEKLISAEIDCFVDLDPSQKGVHMSRFPELFEEAIDEVRIAARYPLERRTPVTGLLTQEMISIVGIAAATESRVRRIVGVEATGI